MEYPSPHNCAPPESPSDSPWSNPPFALLTHLEEAEGALAGVGPAPEGAPRDVAERSVEVKVGEVAGAVGGEDGVQARVLGEEPGRESERK